MTAQSPISYTIPLASPALRDKAVMAVRKAPDGFRVTFEEPRRSNDQNARFHAMVREIARNCEYYGQKRSENYWKQLFVGALGNEEMAPSLDGNGFTIIRKSTSRMSKAELSELIELVAEYGARHAVKFAA